MKKFLKITGIILLLLIAAIIIIPFAFKGKIIEIVKTETNKNINATVDFGDLDLSLIRSFPNLNLSLENISVDGKAPFEGTRLANIEDLNLVLDIMSVISGDQIKIKKINLEGADIYVKVLEDGTANYDIAISDSTAVEEEEVPEEESSFSMDIQEYSLMNSKITYDDESLAMLFILDELNHEGSGDFTQDIFTLRTNSEVKKTTVVYEGTSYLKNANVDLKVDLEMDLPNMKFTFMENELIVNNLFLGVDGWLAMPEDDIDMDINFFSKKSELTTILSLVPAEFTQDLDGVETAGKVALEGFVKGIYNDNSMPGFGIDLLVEDGRVQYPDLPRSIENIQVKLNVNSPAGADMDKMVVDMPVFHMEIGKTAGTPNTIDATLNVKTPESDPQIKTKVDADLDLGAFKDVIPLEEGDNIAGLLNAHFALDGRLSAIESQNFDNFSASGNASLRDFIYTTADMNVAVPSAQVNFTPANLDIPELKVIYDQMNMEMSGSLENYVAYALTDTTLKGNFSFYADKIDLNKFMESDSTVTSEDVDTTAAPAEVMLIPDNLDLTLNAKIDQVLFDSIVINNVAGVIRIVDEVASLNNLSLSTLGGEVVLNGSYNTQNHSVPKMDFSYDIRSMDIQQVATSFVTVESLAPIAKHTTGEFSSKFNMNTDLGADMSPILNTLSGGGNLKSPQVTIEGFGVMEKLADKLKIKELQSQTVKDIDLKFAFKDGKVIVEPFDVKLDKIDANISGFTTFEQELGYVVKLKVPTEMLGGDANQFAQGLLSQANNALGSNLSMGEFINFNVNITGTITDPKIAPGIAGTEGGESLIDQAKDKVKEEVEEKVDEIKEEVREDLSKKADELIETAEKQADKVREEAKKAADRLRSEGEKNAKKLEDEAKNPLAKAGAKLAADKLRKEANQQADNLEAEADKRAQDIINRAKEEADKLKN